eukprot:m.71822 g.71822  ORF g.71822 m.71822 type:complete len:359 (+) comp16098_c0_seq2:634-1710(+)
MFDTVGAVAHGLAGGIAATIALFLFYPIDIVRTLMHVETDAPIRKISSTKGYPSKISFSSGWTFATLCFHQHGISGLYSGVGSSMITQFISYAIYFVSYEALKSSWCASVPTLHHETLHVSTTTSLCIAAAAGVLYVLSTAPLWTAITRIKTQRLLASPSQSDVSTSAPKHSRGTLRKSTGLLGTMVLIAREEGVGALWNGTTASLVLVINPMLQFAMYEQCKQLVIRHDVHIWVDARLSELLLQEPGRDRNEPSTDMPGIVYLILGAWAKFFATVTTYPLQVAQSRLRVEHKGPSDTMGTLLRIAREGHLFVGIETKLLQTVLTSALMLLIYEKIVGATATAIHLLLFLMYFLCNHI